MNNKIIFYSTHCPKCMVLEMKLKKKGVDYETCDDVEAMKELGIKSAPALSVNGEVLSFVQAVSWVNNL